MQRKSDGSDQFTGLLPNQIELFVANHRSNKVLFQIKRHNFIYKKCA